MYINRAIENEITRLLGDNKIIILLGARQVGKTTMIEPFVHQEGGILFYCDIEVDWARLLAASTLASQDVTRLLGSLEWLGQLHSTSHIVLWHILTFTKEVEFVTLKVRKG